MDFYRSQLVATAVLATWNIGVFFALATASVSTLVMRRLGVQQTEGSEGSVILVLSVVVGIGMATVTGRKIMPALKRLGRVWSTVALLVLVVATFVLFPSKFDVLAP